VLPSLSLDSILMLAIRFALIFPAIVLHEIAHGYVAHLLGDDTAKRAGRLTLNPIPHIDLVGTIILPIVMLVLSGGAFFFGYAKPVPINPRAFKNERMGMALTGVAGPVTNIALGFIVGFATRFIPFPEQGVALGQLDSLVAVLLYFAYANLVLAFFNLIPIPPLDGSRVVQWFLPDRARRAYHSIEPYGFLIIVAITWLPTSFDPFGWYIANTVVPLFSAITGLG